MRRVRANEVGALTMVPPDRVWRVDVRAEAAARCDEERKSADVRAPHEGVLVARPRSGTLVRETPPEMKHEQLIVDRRRQRKLMTSAITRLDARRWPRMWTATAIDGLRQVDR